MVDLDSCAEVAPLEGDERLELLQKYLDHLLARNKSPRTIRTFESILRKFLEYIGSKQLEEVGVWDLDGFLAGLRKKGYKESSVYTAAVAVGLALSGHPLPNAVVEPLNLVGKATIPLMLLLLGNRLRSTRLSQVGLALIASLLRLGLGLGLGLVAVSLLGLEGYSRAAVLLGSAMPAAVLNFVFSEKYKLEPELVASTVVVSTALGIVFIPLVLWIIGPLGTP